MEIIRVFEHNELPVPAVAKRLDGLVVVLVSADLPSERRRRLLEELLTPVELLAYDQQSGG